MKLCRTRHKQKNLGQPTWVYQRLEIRSPNPYLMEELRKDGIMIFQNEGPGYSINCNKY